MREFASMMLFVAFLMLVDWIAYNGRYTTAVSTDFSAQYEILALDAQRWVAKAGAFGHGDP
jgi:hypothetical protein